ncbi:MAG: hypothetical protein U0736_20590 [Gemmataceae bacterium]
MARKRRDDFDSPEPAGDEAAPLASPAEPRLDLEIATPPPTATVVPAASLAPLEDRIRRLEDTITQLQALDGLEERIADRLQSVQRDPPPAPPAASPVLDTARALMNVSRVMLPADPSPAAAPRPAGPAREWLLQNVVAELRAMYFMHVDPRYRMSLVGRVVPPILLVAFFLSGYWVPLTTCGLGGLLGPFVTKPIDLALCYALFKILSFEARRFRETAPDLPPNLRL